jgi:hypothetical protein
LIWCDAQIDVEKRIRAVVGERLRLALVLVVEEQVDAIAPDRAAIRRAQLLVRVREHPILDEVGGVEGVVPEVPRERAGRRVRARLGDGVDDHPHRAALRRIEPVGDELELRDRVAAETRLAEVRSGDAVLDLLPFHVDLEGERPARNRRLAAVVRAVARRQQRQVEPVASVERQLLHLPRVDIRADGRRRHVEERRFTREDVGP